MRNQVSAWLKAEIMEGYSHASKDFTEPVSGTPQGGVISPLLANIALHGMENHLKEFVGNMKGKPRPSANRGTTARRKALSLIRYADDFVIIHENQHTLELCINEAKIWLAQVGLQLNLDKSAIRDGRQGFHFLGFQIIQVVKDGDFKVKITPSREKQRLFLLKIRKIIQTKRNVSSYTLVTTLRPIIIGWANYYRYCECKAVFSKLTNLIFQKLRAWVFRRDTRNGRLVIKEKYFPSGKEYSFKGNIYKDNWILNGTQKSKGGIKKEAFLPHIVWVASEKYTKITGDKSPFDGDHLYWGVRNAKYSDFSTRESTLLKRQDGRCNWCKQKFTQLDGPLEVDHVIPVSRGGADEYINLQLLHKHCHIKKTSQDLKQEKPAGAG
jgi:RNA-directed DNA polymerase